MFVKCHCRTVPDQVDKHIRKLDADLARFEADIKEKGSGTGADVESASQKSVYNTSYDTVC